MISLSTDKLLGIGNDICKKLRECGVTEKALLRIDVDAESFKKIDEDVFFTMQKKGAIDKEETYIPVEEEIQLSFPLLEISIKEKKQNG